LSNDRQVEVFGDVLLITPKNSDLDDALQMWTPSTLYWNSNAEANGVPNHSELEPPD
jgi:hypothetical protein